MLVQPSRVLRAVQTAEELASSIMMDKRTLVDLDRRRQSNQECLAAYRRGLTGSETPQATSSSDANCSRATASDSQSIPFSAAAPKQQKAWVSLGSFFLRLPTDDIKQLLVEDQQKLDEEISAICEGMKVKMRQLQQLRPSALDPGMVDIALREARVATSTHPAASREPG